MRNQIFNGLKSYHRGQSDIFFGREKSIESALEILQNNKILTISGDSGSGKTSFAKAGVIGRIMSGFTGRSGRGWSIFSTRTGITPIENLCRCLSENDGLYLRAKPKASDFRDYTGIIEEKKELGLIDIYKNSEVFEKKNVLILIDQVEDLFKYSKAFNSTISDEDDLLINLIYKTVKNKSCSIYFILCVESLYLSKLNIYGKFSELLSLSQFNLPSINVNSLISDIKNKYSFTIAENILAHIQIELQEKPLLLPNFQFLLYKQSNDDDFRKITLNTSIYENFGGLENILNHCFEKYFKAQHKNVQNDIENIFRALINADIRGSNSFYQKFSYIKLYCEKNSTELTKIILNINEEFGHILDIISPSSTDIKSKHNFILNDDDIIILRHPKSLNLTRLGSIQDEEFIFFNEIKKLDAIVNYDKGINDKDLISALEFFENKCIGEKWSTKYFFDYNKIKRFIDKEHEKKIKQKEFYLNQQRKLKIRKRFWTIILVLLLPTACSIAIHKHVKLKNLENENYKLNSIEKQNDTLVHKNDSLSKYVVNLNNELRQDQAKILEQKIEISKKQKLIAENLEELDQEQKRLNDANIRNAEKESQINQLDQELQINQLFIDLSRREIKLMNKINEEATKTKLLRVSEKENIINQAKIALDLYTEYKTIKNSKEDLLKSSISDSNSFKKMQVFNNGNDISVLRKLSNNVISKINGVENIIDVDEFDLLKNYSEKSQLKSIRVSDNGRIFCAGKSGFLYYSIANNKNFDKIIFERVNFNSEIKEILPINDDVLVVLLNTGGIWYMSLSENTQVRIYPNEKQNKFNSISSLIYKNGSIFSSNNNMLIEYNLESKLLRETPLPLKEDDYFIDLTFDGINSFYALTKRGNIYEYDHFKKTNRLIFHENNRVLSKEEKITEIRFQDNHFLFSTSKGWIYSFKKNRTTLEYQNRILAHESDIISFHFNQNLNMLFSCSVQGKLCLNYLEKDSFNTISRTTLNLGSTNIINDIVSITQNDKSYFLTASNKGDLIYWGLDVEDDFNYLKSKISN